MRKIHELILRGGGLIPIDEPEMVRRYNACLIDMGLRPTELKRFHIDCMGWSPEIAEEKGDNSYLSYSEANPLAIILMPKQRYAPIYFPFHSFDWALMKQWFDMHTLQIVEITKSSGIWLDIDQEVETYQDLRDLLMVDGVIVRANTPSRIMQESAQQRELVRNIMQERDIIMIEDLALSLAESAKSIGDMRYRQVVIGDMQFSDVSIFYTRAFGGSFVFCGVGLRGDDNHFVLNKNTAWRAKGVDSIIDRNIFARLEKLGLIDYEVGWWKNEIHQLKIMRDSFLMEVLDVKFPEVAFYELNSAKQKGLIQDVSEELPVEYFELKYLIKTLEKGEIPKKIDDCIRPFLAHPSSKTNALAAEVLWHVLTLVCDGRQIVHLYRYDKDDFFVAYDSWKTPRQKWARKMIEEYYQYRLMKI
ncbi:MAG: DUF6638 family protein [Parcubacteria group bacterium]|jgi:hypothetical protein